MTTKELIARWILSRAVVVLHLSRIHWLRPGFVRYWDDKAKAPYLWNEETKQFVTYDDEESVKLKCEYVKEKNLGGIMFWQYSSDPKEYLIKTINQNLFNH